MKSKLIIVISWSSQLNSSRDLIWLLTFGLERMITKQWALVHMTENHHFQESTCSDGSNKANNLIKKYNNCSLRISKTYNKVYIRNGNITIMADSPWLYCVINWQDLSSEAKRKHSCTITLVFKLLRDLTISKSSINNTS